MNRRSWRKFPRQEAGEENQTVSRPLFISCLVQFPFYRPKSARHRRSPFQWRGNRLPALTCLGLLFKERKPLTKLDRNLTEFYREKKLGRSSFSSNSPPAPPRIALRSGCHARRWKSGRHRIPYWLRPAVWPRGRTQRERTSIAGSRPIRSGQVPMIL